MKVKDSFEILNNIVNSSNKLLTRQKLMQFVDFGEYIDKSDYLILHNAVTPVAFYIDDVWIVESGELQYIAYGTEVTDELSGGWRTNYNDPDRAKHGWMFGEKDIADPYSIDDFDVQKKHNS